MNKIIQGDCLEQLKTLEPKSINMCMTSPPYWALRDYGTANWEGGSKDCDHKIKSGNFIGPNSIMKQEQADRCKHYKDICGRCGAKRVDKQLGLEPTFDEYINNLCNVFDEVKRVLRDDGTCWVNIGDTYHGGGGMSGITEDTPSFKNDKVLQARLKSKAHTSYEVLKERNKLDYPKKSLVMIPFRFAIEMVNRGWILRNTIIWHKPNCMPSSAKDRFTVDFEYLFLFSKKKKYYFETQYEPLAESTLNDSRLDKGLVKHKSGKTIDKNCQYSIKGMCANSIGRNKRTVWTICPRPFKEAHFAVFPEELCETPIKAGCPKGGIVLDPFFGSGTTGLVALKQGKKFIGIELNPEYIEIANARIKPFLEQTRLDF